MTEVKGKKSPGGGGVNFQKVSEEVECNAGCQVCKGRIKYDSEIRCDERQNWYHELCILEYIEHVVAFSEYIENFLRHTRDRQYNPASEKWHCLMAIRAI